MKSYCEIKNNITLDAATHQTATKVMNVNNPNQQFELRIRILNTKIVKNLWDCDQFIANPRYDTQFG